MKSYVRNAGGTPTLRNFPIIPIQTADIGDGQVTNAKLADMAQATIKGRAVGAGTGDPQDLTATQATAILNAFTSALKGLVPASGGGTVNFLRADGTFAAPSAAVLQVLQTTNTANTNLTTALPIDDTIPTVSEGTEVLSLAITPADNTNKVLVTVDLWGSANNQMAAIALFRGSTCIAAKVWDIRATTQAQPCALTFLDSPASASAQTYSVRVGTTAGTAMRLNGTNGGRLFGGVGASTLTLQEIAA